MHTTDTARGFTIVEAIVALAIVTTGVLALASLAAQVTTTVAGARRHTVAALLADQGIAARAAQPLTVTAADCLQRDVGGCVEMLDAAGQIVTQRPAFVRRWRVTSLPGVTPPAAVLAVCVVPVQERRGVGDTPGSCVTRIVWEPGP